MTSGHARLMDLAINDALRSATGCLRPTPADNLPIQRTTFNLRSKEEVRKVAAFLLGEAVDPSATGQLQI